MQFAVFDIETRVDKGLVKTVYFPRESLTDAEAYERVRGQLIADSGSDFFPISFHVPISIAVGLVNGERVLTQVETLCAEDYSEEAIVRVFWERVERFNGTLVSFNGRNFDLPVLELQALKYGCQAPRYFNQRYGHRYRYSEEGHYDLYEFLTNNGVHRIRGGFNLLSTLIGYRGKGDIDGSMVQGLWEGNRLADIHRYCREDVIQTYFLFLRVELMRGRIEPDGYRRVLAETESFLEGLDPANRA